MKCRLLLALLLGSYLSALAQQNDPRVVNFEEFESYLSNTSDTTYIINFWATWCKPCVEELPYFENIARDYSEKPVKVLLVSMDFENQIEKRVVPFIEEEKIKSEVVVLVEPNANAWIDKVDPRWSGAIPATIIYRADQRSFYGDQFASYDELKSIIESYL